MTVEGKVLEPYRVDISKSGDSILTDISDGIAHSQLVLADVSSIGRDAITGNPYRNANVMYEVGIALACRQPSEVLLVRDDHDKFLFDVSTIPHVTLDFTEKEKAIQKLTECMMARIREQQYVSDARVQIAIQSLTTEETLLLRKMKKYDTNTVWGGLEARRLSDWLSSSIARLLDKGIIVLAGLFNNEKPAFRFTPFGCIIHDLVISGLANFKTEESGEIESKAEG